MKGYLLDVVMTAEGLRLPASSEGSSTFVVKGMISCD